MLLSAFLNSWLIFLKSYSYCTSFNPTAEHVIPTGIQINDTKAANETQPVIEETKLIKCSV